MQVKPTILIVPEIGNKPYIFGHLFRRYFLQIFDLRQFYFLHENLSFFGFRSFYGLFSGLSWRAPSFALWLHLFRGFTKLILRQLIGIILLFVFLWMVAPEKRTSANAIIPLAVAAT
jgi:hypothetical protein